MPSILVARRFGRRRRPRIPPTQRAIDSAEQAARNRTHPKMVLQAGDIRLTVPYAPRTSNHTGFAPVYTEVARPGRHPLVLRTAPGLWKQSFDLFLGNVDLDYPIGRDFLLLKSIAESYEPITIINGPGINRTWRITGLSMDAVERNHNNQISRATVSIEMTEVVDLKPAAGPTQGGKKPPPATSAPPKPGTPEKATAPKTKAPRIHTVTKGQSLSIISNIYYRTPSRWREIATANNIRNANHIHPGQKLRIP